MSFDGWKRKKKKLPLFKCCPLSIREQTFLLVGNPNWFAFSSSNGRDFQIRMILQQSPTLLLCLIRSIPRLIVFCSCTWHQIVFSPTETPDHFWKRASLFFALVRRDQISQIQCPGQGLAVRRTVNLLIQSNNRSRDGQSLSWALYCILFVAVWYVLFWAKVSDLHISLSKLLQTPLTIALFTLPSLWQWLHFGWIHGSDFGIERANYTREKKSDLNFIDFAHLFA